MRDDRSDAGATGPLSVAVVIATFNRPDQLAALLADLAVQDHPPTQVVVVDDGSEVAANPARPPGATFELIVLHQANSGPARARDTGIAAVTADVIVILDDDMRVEPGFVDAHRRAHEAGATVVQAPFRCVIRPTTPLFDQFTIRQHEGYFDKVIASPDALDPSRLTTGNVSFRTELYRSVGGFDTSLRRCEDRELGLRFAEAGAVTRFAADAVARHDEEPESIDRWLGVAREYGAAELAIARRHPSSLDPWGLFHEMPRPARPVIRWAVQRPRRVALLVRILVAIGRGLEKVRLPPVALKAYGLAYALSWFGGLFDAFVSRDEAIASLRRAVAAGRPLG